MTCSTKWILPFVILVSACGETTNLKSAQTPQMVKIDGPVHIPPQDTRSYKSFELANQLKVLLVSDPETERSAAALAVGVGSEQDPDESLGLAHFVEHMLFLGSEKYPSPHGFKQFMTQNGGMYNAYTTADQTNYFFEVSATSLAPALDRFSQFFISPTFDENYIDSELKVVDAEYQMLKGNEGWVSLSLMKQAINPEHSFSRFAVGSSQSLAGDKVNPIKNRVADFYHTYYAANAMTLVVLGKESVETLQKLVEKSFSTIKATADPSDVTKPVIENSLFLESKSSQRLTMALNNPLPQMALSFSVPAFVTYYQQKPEEFIANILNDNNEGGLKAQLKEKGWINDMMAGSRLSTRSYATFDIQFALNEEGMKHYNEIAGAVFQYLRLIKQEGISDNRYSQQQQRVAERFRFQEKIPAIAYVGELANNLQSYPVRDVFSGPRLMANYEASSIEQYLNYLTPEKALLSLSGTGKPLKHVDDWSGHQYSLSAIDAATIAQWQAQSVVSHLSLPPVSIASLAESSETPSLELVVAGVENSQSGSLEPTIIDYEQGFTLWYKQDDKFMVPKTDTYFMLESSAVKASPQSTVMKGLYIMMINESLLPSSSQFRDAGVSYDIHPAKRGISLSLSGMTEPQSALLDMILKVVAGNSFTEQHFTIAKQNLASMYQQYQQSQPIDKVMHAVSVTLDPLAWEMDALTAELKSLSLKDVRAYQKTFLSQLEVTGLSHGNLNKNQALQLGNQVQKALKITENGAVMPQYQVINLPQGESWLRALEGGNSGNIAVVLYSQVQNGTVKDAVSVRLLGYLLQSELFNTLRTEHSMGYIVGAAPVPVHNVDGLAVYAQSPDQSVLEVQKELEAELKGMDARIAALGEGEFKQVKNAMLSFLTQEPNLKARSDFYWMKISLKSPPFLQKEQLIETLEGLSKADFVAFCQQFLSAETRNGLAIHSQPAKKSMTIGNTFKVINSLAEFKGNANYITK